ncbi:MAG: TerC family protein [Thermodesulfovibrionales bacterium]
MEWLTDSQIWIGLITLTVLEIILGIDNIVVISILSGKLPPHEQQRARSLGIGMALVTRVLFLLSIAWLASLTKPLFTLLSQPVSVRDCILIAGGLFLLVKGTREIHSTIEEKEEEQTAKVYSTVSAVVFQIILFDIVFSLDSVITAIGMARHLGVMVAAVVIALLLMLAASGAISSFIHRHPSVKILALSFLLMVGVTLLAEGLEFHVPKGYIYFAMGFSGFIEALNLAAGHRKARKQG